MLAAAWAAPASAAPPSVSELVVPGQPRIGPGEVRLDSEDLQLTGARTVGEALEILRRRVRLGARPVLRLNGLRTLDFDAIANLPAGAVEHMTAVAQGPEGPAVSIQLKARFRSASAEAKALTAPGAQARGEASAVTPARVATSDLSGHAVDRALGEATEVRATGGLVSLGAQRQVSVRLEAAQTRRDFGAGAERGASLLASAKLSQAAAAGATWLGSGQLTLTRERGLARRAGGELELQGRLDGAPLPVLGPGARFDVGGRWTGRSRLGAAGTPFDGAADLAFHLAGPGAAPVQTLLNLRAAGLWAGRGPAGGEAAASAALTRGAWQLEIGAETAARPVIVRDQLTRSDLLGAVVLQGPPQTVRVVSRPLAARAAEDSRSAYLAAAYAFGPESSLSARIGWERRANLLVRPRPDVAAWIDLLPGRHSISGAEVDASDAILDRLAWRYASLVLDSNATLAQRFGPPVRLHLNLAAQTSWDVEAALAEAPRLAPRDIVRVFDLDRADSSLVLQADAAVGGWRVNALALQSRRRSRETSGPQLDLTVERTWRLGRGVSVSLFARGQDLLRDNADDQLPGLGLETKGRAGLIGLRVARETP